MVISATLIPALPDVEAALANFKAAHNNAGALADPAQAQSQALLAWMEAVTAHALHEDSSVTTAQVAAPTTTPAQIAEQAAQILEQAIVAAAQPHGEGAAQAAPVAAPVIAPSNAGV